jgi:squalene-hopene/tetraprenyl-beta-curcumene cyclase
MEREILKSQFQSLCAHLIQELNSNGFWTGMLSSSALSTAVAIVTLKINGNSDDTARIRFGFNWLKANINSDGGFGDTPQSVSNVSTSLLCYAAIYYCQPDCEDGSSILISIEHYLKTKNISFSAGDISTSILNFYGKDLTFSVPILSMLLICGVLHDDTCNRIPQLPFELALLPASLYRFFNLQVVSYAVPALIAVGIFLHTKRKKHLSIPRLYRDFCVDKAIRKLISLMPASGGFLEAIPLTGFVSMSLIASGKCDNFVVKNGILFLQKQQRTDGSWPIDTDLSTWVTTLGIKALGPQLTATLGTANKQLVKKHLLSVQYNEVHPFNLAKPGGWGWTSASGAVPDADDTSGAILALLEMYEGTEVETGALTNGCTWLVELQNNDGGFPTFCKGWGRLPFDSSCADLTGHALLALFSTIETLKDNLPCSLERMFLKSASKAVRYLQKHQSPDGHWLPLWFGNQFSGDRKNPVYGTAKVCIYLTECLDFHCVNGELRNNLSIMVSAAQQFLSLQQNNDGSWGGIKGTSGSTEETALAVCALAKSHTDACLKGFRWLSQEQKTNKLKASPIGLYFAALWYDEKMYPLVYYIEALRRFLY